MSGCPYHAVVQAAGAVREPRQIGTRLRGALRRLGRSNADSAGSLFEQPRPPRKGRLMTALSALGKATTDVLNSPVFDLKLGPHQINLLRVLLDYGAVASARVDPRLPGEYLGVIGTLARGGLHGAVASRRVRDQHRGNKEAAVAAQLAGEPLDPYTPDGDTWTYTVPNAPLVSFTGPDAVRTRFDQPSTGALIPVYSIKGKTALREVLAGKNFDRGAVPYHYLSQAVGSSSIEPTAETKAVGLFAGQVQHNSTWKGDRRLGQQMVGPKALGALVPGMSTALDAIGDEMDARIDSDPEGVFDASTMMSRIAYRMIVQASFGNVDQAAFQRMGQELTGPVRDMLGYVFEASQGRTGGHARFARSVAEAKRIFGEMIDLLAELDAAGELSHEQRSAPLVAFALDGDADGNRVDSGRLFSFLLPVIFGGHETTGFTLSWAVWHLARDPELEARVTGEIEAFRAAHGGRPVTPADIDERPVTAALMHEIGRRYPPIMAVPRTALSDGIMPPDPDTGIGAFHYPKDALFLCEVAGLHRDADLYPNPLAFDIDRWLVDVTPAMSRREAGKTVRRHINRLEKNFRYLLFGAGPAKCVGQPFNQLEFFLVLDALLPRFRFELVDPTREVKETAAAISGPEPGAVAVRLRRRTTRGGADELVDV